MQKIGNRKSVYFKIDTKKIDNTVAQERYVMVSQADLDFDAQPCKVLTIRDMTAF